VKIRKNRWVLPENAAWISPGDIHADPLSDLKTTQGSLSVWIVEEDQSNLHRVAVALAANCEHLSSIDYILFDGSIVDDLSLKLVRTLGKTPDSEANATWHRDLVELSASKLADLARRMFHNCCKSRILRKKLGALILDAVHKTRFGMEDVKLSLRNELP